MVRTKTARAVVDGGPEPRVAVRAKTPPDVANTAQLASVGPRATRRHEVGQILSQAIVEGRLAPGRLYSVESLALQLNVSRTPVREALITLARNGLVQLIPNRGVRILEISSGDFIDLCRIRRWIEAPCAALAAENATAEQLETLSGEFDAMLSCARNGDEVGMWRRERAFHRLLMEASGNRRAAAYTTELREVAAAAFTDELRDLMIRALASGGTTGSLIEIAEQHRSILDAVGARDAERVKHEVEVHLTQTEQLLTRAALASPAGRKRATRLSSRR